jgi:hypothetical protein
MLSALALLVTLQGTPEAPVEEAPRRYGDQGSSHFGLMLGLGGGSGGFAWAGGFEYGYFVLDGVAPGIDAEASGGSHLPTIGMTLGTLRLVPVRLDAFSLFLVGRGGRVFLSDHPDGWGVGGGAGLIYFTSARFGIQLTYDVLRLVPSSFCAGLDRCTLHGFGVGLAFGF